MPEASNLIGLRADVASAARSVAPSWPLTTFVAVNPLQGFEHLPFEAACAEARRWMGVRTHLSLEAYREAHRSGAIGEAPLREAIARHDPLLLLDDPVVVGDTAHDPVDLVVLDLLHGPDADAVPPAPSSHDDAWLSGLRDYVGTWCGTFTGDSTAAWQMPDRELGLYRAWHRLVRRDPRLRELVGRSGRSWIRTLPDEPVAALDRALDTLGVDDAGRVDVLRSLLLSVPGWASHARWCDEWAHADQHATRLHTIDLVALIGVLHAAAGRVAGPPAEHREPSLLGDRVAAVADVIGAERFDEHARIRRVLSHVSDGSRAAIWLAAHELTYRDALLASLAGTPTPTPVAPAAQMVMCIDVRSEVLRRHLERLGPYETFGFAGFFGIPVWWRPAGSAHADARCPVLVSPRHEVAEIADGAALPARSIRLGVTEAFHRAKGGLGSPFALAESAGWLLGPAAALRTLARPAAALRPAAPAPTGLALEAERHGEVGLPLATRVQAAEALLGTISLTDLAPLVVLCGHGSRTVNNTHASALDCGACGGAAGGPSARVAAAIMNDPVVRTALAERGTDIPATTWFVPAEHDTASDVVTLLDLHLVPESHQAAVDRFERDLAEAAEATSIERAARLPGDRRRVRARGRDWAQVRPEWGLAGNAAFIAARRATTRGLDLGGRTFLHSYDADLDPEGVALETIMTAPLVVAQWINSQYYFSAVDPDAFGAGDKTIANATGGMGARRGPTGDLAIGLPEQSLAADGRLAHQPLRLLAVIEAPLDRIEAIIHRNPSVRTLVEHEWIHVVARADCEDAWMERTPAGTWTSHCGVLATADLAATARP